jgi:small subunit ribosomal protein S12e
MSDTEMDEAPRAPDEVDLNKSLQEVLKSAARNDGLARGLRGKKIQHFIVFFSRNKHLSSLESVKALDRREAHLCVLASNCDEPNYVKLIEALCAEHSINLLRVDDNKKLGEWAGLCKLDKDGKARKVVRCSCCVVRDLGDETQAHDQLLEHMKKSKQSA